MADRIPSVDSVTKLFADSVRTALTTDILAGKAGSFSVKNYSAVGDGTTDDTAAIQAAFDACTTTSGNPRRGGEIVFPKGKFRITGTLSLTRVSVKVRGSGWSDWTSGYNAGSYGTTLIWDGPAGQPMIKVEACLAPLFEDLLLVGNGTNNPSAGIEFYTTSTTLNGQAVVRRCQFGRFAATAGMSGIVMGTGLLFDGPDNVQNDRGIVENCRFDGCTTGINLSQSQNVLHRIRSCTFAECGTPISTAAQVSIESCYFSTSSVRDLDISTAARVTCDEIASESGVRFARLRGGSELIVRGGYFQCTTNFAGDQIWIDAVDDSRTSVRLKDFRLTSSGYSGAVPVIASHAATNSALGHKVLEVDGLRWYVGSPQTPGVTESFFSVTPIGTNDSSLVYGRIQPGSTQNAGPDVPFFNLLRGSGDVFSLSRDDRLLSVAETEIPDAGEFVPDIDKWVTSTGVVPASQNLCLAYFTAKRTETISNITVIVGGTGAAATPTLIRFGIYSVAANGDLTLIASTANDTTLLATAFNVHTKALSASFTKVAGQRYATAFLVVSGTTMPTMTGHTVVNASNVSARLAVSKRRSGLVTAQANLPSTVTAGSVGNVAWRVGMHLT